MYLSRCIYKTTCRFLRARAIYSRAHLHTDSAIQNLKNEREKIKMKENKSENVYTICVCAGERAREMYKTRAQILNFMNRMRKNEEAMKNTRDAMRRKKRSLAHTHNPLYAMDSSGGIITQPFYHCRYVDVLLILHRIILILFYESKYLVFEKYTLKMSSCEFPLFIVLFLRNNCCCLFYLFPFFCSPRRKHTFTHKVQLLSLFNSFRITKKEHRFHICQITYSSKMSNDGLQNDIYCSAFTRDGNL